MEIIKTGFDGLLELKPKVFGDQRGYFFESFKKSLFEDLSLESEFVQDNESFSKKGTLRGLHYQTGTSAQGKLVRVVTGKVMDIVVDIRHESKTYGEYYKAILTAEDHNMMYVPPGFAHGFAALEDSIFYYQCTQYYDPKAEEGILWNDPALGIDWGVDAPIISAKDMEQISFEQYKSNPSF